MLRPEKKFLRVASRIFFQRKTAIWSLDESVHFARRSRDQFPEMPGFSTVESLRSEEHQVQIALLVYYLFSRRQFEARATAGTPLEIDPVETFFEESESLERRKEATRY
jgi:hypothetical protein